MQNSSLITRNGENAVRRSIPQQLFNQSYEKKIIIIKTSLPTFVHEFSLFELYRGGSVSTKLRLLIFELVPVLTTPGIY